jgi:hypothetical protein
MPNTYYLIDLSAHLAEADKILSVWTNVEWKNNLLTLKHLFSDYSAVALFLLYTIPIKFTQIGSVIDIDELEGHGTIVCISGDLDELLGHAAMEII